MGRGAPRGADTTATWMLGKLNGCKRSSGPSTKCSTTASGLGNEDTATVRQLRAERAQLYERLAEHAAADGALQD
jgi:hypothetical protein